MNKEHDSFRALGEEIGLLLQHAKDRAREIEKRAEEQAEVTLSAARAEEAKVRASLTETVGEAEARAAVILAQAERAAAETTKKAAAAARKLTKDAEEEASNRVKQIERRIARLQQIEAVLRDRLQAQGAVAEPPRRAGPSTS